MTPWIKRYAPVLAFVLVTIVAVLAVERSAYHDALRLREAQVRSCDRVNLLRAESNERIEAHIIERDVVLELIFSARASIQNSETVAVRRTARNYTELADKLSKVTFDKLELVECEKEFPKP